MVLFCLKGIASYNVCYTTIFFWFTTKMLDNWLLLLDLSFLKTKYRMKQRIILAMVTLFTISMSAQQGLKIGVQGGLPIEYTKEIGVVLGVDAGHMWALGEVVDAGIMAGFIHGFAEKYDTEDPLVDLPSIQFAPVAASVSIWPSNSFSFGIDGGYAFGLNDGNEGGLYYRPQLGYLLGPFSEVNLSYSNVELDGKAWNTVTLGFLFTIQLKPSYR